MNYSTSTLSRSTARSVVLCCILLLQAISFGTSRRAGSVVISKLQESPFGIGIGRAFSERHRRFAGDTGRITTVSTVLEEDDEEDYETAWRSAAVTKEEAVALRRTTSSHLVMRKKTENRFDDELEWIDDKVMPCSAVSQKQATATVASHSGRGGATVLRPLLFWESMVCGAVSRSIAQTVMHPANTMKTILQSTRGADRPTLGQLMKPSQFRMLTRGAGANFVLSVPHGAVNFAVLEFVRGKMNKVAEGVPFLQERLDAIGPALDFASSAVSTICCSIVSTPQMVITDNIMAGNFPHLPAAVSGLYGSRGVRGFYGGWWPGLVGKIPSYALTWTFFQQLKRVRDIISDRPAKNVENTIMGCVASAASVCIMIPVDTVKTRLVVQASAKALSGAPYKGIIDCAVRIATEEGVGTFYRGLAPRLMSVVPMIGIQFGVYEAMKKAMLSRQAPTIENLEYL